MRPTIQFINNSTVISDAQLKPIIEAVQIQVSRDFSPVWNMNANLVQLPQGQNPDPTAWWCLIADDSDQASALGYHDFTNGGQPLGKVFAKTDIMAGSSISVTISHEVMEMCADFYINSCIVSPDGGKFWALEVADACEDDQFGYNITLPTGEVVLVSDFQTRAWFGCVPSVTGTTKYDFCGHITAPFQVLAGGYASFFSSDDKQWYQATTDQHNVAARKHPGSRFEKRLRFVRNQCGKLSTVDV